MDKREFLGIMQKIKYAYGDRFQSLTDDMLSAWYECLGNLDGERLQSAAVAYINENRYPPTIAELRAGYWSQKKSDVDLATLFEKAASYYPGGHNDSAARSAYLDLFKNVHKDGWEKAAQKIEQAIRRYVLRCEKNADSCQIQLFSEFLKEIELEVDKE